MERLKKGFVTTKRRLAERVFQAAGIHESSETEEDKAFQVALASFDSLVRDIREVEEAMKENLILWHALAESQFRLAQQMHLTFTNGVMNDVSSRNVAANQQLLSEFSHVKQVYLNNVLHPTNELLRKSMPEIQALVEKRTSLKLDFDSYARRANAEAAKDPTTAHSQKLTGKKEAAQRKLEECTLKIRKHLDELEHRRPSMCVSELSSLIGIQVTCAQRQHQALSELVPVLPHSAVTMCLLSHGHNHSASNAEVIPA